MEFAEQERRPEQVVTPEYQSVSPEGSRENSTPPGNGVNYSKVPKALQNTPVFGELPAPTQEKAQGQSTTDVPVAKGGNDSAPLGRTVAHPVLIAGGLGSALPAPSPNPLQGAAEAFGKGAAVVGRGAAALGGLSRLGVAGVGAAILLGGPLSKPVGKEEAEWLRRNAARQQVLKSKTSRESDNHVTKQIRAEAGRTGDPCKIWETEMAALEIALKSTRNPQEIKELNKAKREMQKAGKQLGCDNKQKRKNEKGGDYGNIK